MRVTDESSNEETKDYNTKYQTITFEIQDNVRDDDDGARNTSCYKNVVEFK